MRKTPNISTNLNNSKIMALSEHDNEIVKKIERLDEYGYTQWPEIMHLASQLESKAEYEKWNSICKTYNHLEEASIGEL